jgi:methylaspartate ammonia-lyase
MMAAVKDALKTKELLAAWDIKRYHTAAGVELLVITGKLDTAVADGLTQAQIDALNTEKVHLDNRIVSLATNLANVTTSIETDANGYGYTQEDIDEYNTLILGA